MVTSYPATNLGGALEYRKITLTYPDLSEAGSTSKTVPLFTLGAGSKILGVVQKPTEKWAGPSLSALEISVGSALADDQFDSAYDSFATVGDTELQETALFKSGTSAAQVVNAYADSTDCDLDDLTAGSIDIYLLVLNVTTP